MFINPHTKSFIRNHKALLFFLFLWLFRVHFLRQRNDGGIVINRFVFVQIFAGLCMFLVLLQNKYQFKILFKIPVTRWFSLLYGLGCLSILWGVFPLMGCYFAFENFILLAAFLNLALHCPERFAIERYYIFINMLLLFFFGVTVLFFGNDWHSVSHSTIAALLFVYCAGEISKQQRPTLNLALLRYGLVTGFAGLILTTSSGAIVSTAFAMLFLGFFARNRAMRFFSWFTMACGGYIYLSGEIDLLLQILFPGKTMIAITTGHGRGVIWEMILARAQERPWLGWGYASVERTLPIYCVDAHNAFIGTLGSMGYIGCIFLLMAVLSSLSFCFSNRKYFGMRGVLAAMICGIINSNSSSFFAAQASSQAIAFQLLLVLGVVYYIHRFDDLNTYAISAE